MKKLLLLIPLLADTLTGSAIQTTYIESLGTQPFDTGIVPTSKTRVVLDFEFNWVPSSGTICMGWQATGSKEGLILGITGGKFYSQVTPNNVSREQGAADAQRHTWDLMSGSQKCDDKEYATDSMDDQAAPYPNRTFYLFARHQGWTKSVDCFTKGRLYGCKIYEDGNPVRDYVPWVEGGEIGLYDKVNGKFFALDYTAFTCPMPNEAELEYVESTGNQWLDTGIVPTTATRVDLDFQYSKYPEVKTAGSAGDVIGWQAKGGAEIFLFGVNGNDGPFNGPVAASETTASPGKGDNRRHEVSLLHGRQTFDGAVYASNSFADTAEDGQTLYLFALHAEWLSAPTCHAEVRLYSCKIWDGKTLVRDYVPYKKGDAIGLLEKVSGDFYTPNGTAALKAGSTKVAFRPFVETVKAQQQYIDTGVKPTSATRLVADVQFTAFSGNSVSGWESTGSKEAFSFGVMEASGTYAKEFASKVSASSVKTVIGAADLLRHVWDLRSGSQKLDGKQYATGTIDDHALETAESTMYLGCRHDGWKAGDKCYSSMRIFSCQIYDGNDLVRDFVPAVTYGTAGLYDKVSNDFFPSKSATAFIAAPAATAIASVEMTGTQWCDTGVVPGSQIGVVCDMRVLPAGCKLTGAHAMGWASAGTKEGVLFGVVDGTFGGYFGDHCDKAASYGITADSMRHLWKLSSGLQALASGKRLDQMVTLGTGTIGDTAGAGQTIYLGGRHYGWSGGGVDCWLPIRVYGFKATKGDKVVADLVPSISKGVACLYDRANGIAYPSLHAIDTFGWRLEIDKDQYGMAIMVR